MIDISNLYLQRLIGWRREFHQYPEPGWLEFYTTSKIADFLEEWGYELYVGKEMNVSERMGLPTQAMIERFYDAAKHAGANEKWLSKMEGGYTGVLAVLETGRPGPTVCFRVDIDALPIFESTEAEHVPNRLAFRSQNDGFMHACGHDSHIAIGLGLAEQIMQHRNQLTGTIKIIFQPAEEGVRGAASIVQSPLFDDIDYFFALHIGTGVEAGKFIAGSEGFLATSKFDAIITGVAAHAGGVPEEGKNALLAAAQATVALHSLPPHSKGSHRINVGTLHAGLGRNVIPSTAQIQLEVRGETTEINSFYENAVKQIFSGIETMYGVRVELKKVGEAISVPSSKALSAILADVAGSLQIPYEEYSNFNSGSEDATFFMERIQKNGGLSTYSIIGTELAAGHHHEKFDIREEDMLSAIKIWLNTLLRLQ